MREFRYVLADVFTSSPLLGNQLAVFLDGESLTPEEMQALARETNLSETTFCFPRSGSPSAGVPVRIFTTQEELPFAGHPTLGTAAVLRALLPQFAAAEEVRLQLAAGGVPVRFGGWQESAAVASCFAAPLRGEMRQPLPRLGQQHEHASVAESLGLPVESLDADRVIQTVSTGIPFAVVLVRTVEVLESLALEWKRAERYLHGTDAKFFYVLAPTGDPKRWRARMQFYGGEDPATGSAAGCAAAYLVLNGLVAAATPFVIEQGVEIGRRSEIECQALLQTGDEIPSAASVWSRESYVGVGGSTVLVAEGRFFLP